MEHIALQDLADDYGIVIPKVGHCLKGKFGKRVKETKPKLVQKDDKDNIFHKDNVTYYLTQF